MEYFKKTLAYLGEVGRRAQGTCVPYVGQNFFIFMQFRDEIGQIVPLGVCAPSGKSWILRGNNSNKIFDRF